MNTCTFIMSNPDGMAVVTDATVTLRAAGIHTALRRAKVIMRTLDCTRMELQVTTLLFDYSSTEYLEASCLANR
jgi:hypothetical protein